MTTQDIRIAFLIDGGAARGRIVRIGAGFGAVLAAYPPPVAHLLAETLALAAGLAGGLKFTGVFSLQAQGDGPVSLLVADIDSDGHLRGYARFDAERLAALEGEPTVPRLLGRGHLAFTIDQGPDTDRYQGIVALAGATLAECAQDYFRQSEQIASAIMLAAEAPRDGHDWRAGCLIVQRMPAGADTAVRSAEEADEAWRRSVVLMASTRARELLDPDLAPERLLHRLYHDDGLRLLDARSLEARCRCSAARVESTLRSFPRHEIAELTDASGRVVVTCEFCKADYGFGPDDIERVYAT